MIAAAPRARWCPVGGGMVGEMGGRTALAEMAAAGRGAAQPRIGAAPGPVGTA
jgi:hypothetical protein